MAKARGRSSKKNSKSPKAIIFRRLVIFYSILSFILFFSFSFIFSNNGSCANSESCIKDLSGAFDQQAAQGVFMGSVVSAPEDIALIPKKNVLADTNQPKRIEIDLSLQKIYAFQGDSKVYEFPVSTGKWGATPTGSFTTWIKLRYTRMAGGSKALNTYYNLPNVPYTMYFYNGEVPKHRGFGIHGAYWHNNFGHPMSHGCINMRIEDAGTLYEWADPPTAGNLTYATADSPGTRVIIYGETPNE